MEDVNRFPSVDLLIVCLCHWWLRFPFSALWQSYLPRNPCMESSQFGPRDFRPI